MLHHQANLAPLASWLLGLQVNMTAAAAVISSVIT
jgi:hypothetical protein